MSDLHQRLQEDLAIARGLAEEGRRAPLIGGLQYVVWGVMICLCLTFNWAVTTEALSLTPWSIPLVWFSGMGVAHIWSRAANARLGTLPGASSIGNQVSGAVWRAIGLFLGLFAATLFAALFQAPAWMFGGETADGRNFAAAFSIFLPVSFGAYSVAMAATAVAAKSTMLRTFSWLSLATMVATLALIGRSEQMLVGAAGILVVSALPGLLLMRQARAAHEPK